MQRLFGGYSERRKPHLAIFTALVVSSCLLTGLTTKALGQGLPGLTLFSGVKAENQLPFRLDFGGQTNNRDRYILKIPQNKMKLAVAQFAITYPKYYKGSFDPKKIEVRVKGKKVPLSEVKWDKEGRVIEIFPQEPVPAGSRVDLVLSNVQNPSFGGVYYFNCQVLSPGDVPMLRYLGSWILSIS
jgi:hypothetical protein